MASIAGTNSLYDAYRNSVIGKTSDYSTRVDCDTDVLYAFFSDDGTITPDATDVFQAIYTTSENPAFAAASANPGARLTVSFNPGGSVGTVDAADLVFTGTTVLTGSTSVESFIISKLITNAAASPVLAHFGSATGLPLTPNGADVTVVFNASGVWRF